MEDTSFIDLLKEENISRISIDPRLKTSFSRVLSTIQAYFNANGYTAQRDYSSYLKQFLLEESDKRLSIVCDDKPSKIFASGYYSRPRNLIDIDESNLSSRDLDDLDSTLCHEFIHFLVMHGLIQDDILKGRVDPQIYTGGFINEALTEMLTQQMYPSSRAYKPQTSMMRFANLLTNNVNNYSSFLRGGIDARGGASSWMNFCEIVQEYQKERSEKGYIMSEARTNANYIRAQRYIIQANIHPHLIKDIDEYLKWVDILRQRPAPDTEWTNDFIKRMGENLIRNVSINDPHLNGLLSNELGELSEIDRRLDMYDGLDVVEVEIGGQVVAFDENRNIYGVRGGYSSGWNGFDTLSIQVHGQNKYFDFRQLDFTKRRKDLLARRNQILKSFASTHKRDASAMKSIKDIEGLVRLERFKLPIINKSQPGQYVYVATYKDRVEILDSSMKLMNVKDINLSKFIGTLHISGGTWSKPLGSIESGITFSSLNPKRIKGLSVVYLKKQIKSNLTEQQLADILTEYRLSSEYDEEEEKDLESLKEYALEYRAGKQYELLSEEEKTRISHIIVNENPKYVISTSEEGILVSVMHGDKMAFAADKEEVDIHSGIWRQYLDYIKQTVLQEERKDSIVINTDERGRLLPGLRTIPQSVVHSKFSQMQHPIPEEEKTESAILTESETLQSDTEMSL